MAGHAPGRNAMMSAPPGAVPAGNSATCFPAAIRYFRYPDRSRPLPISPLPLREREGARREAVGRVRGPRREAAVPACGLRQAQPEGRIAAPARRPAWHPPFLMLSLSKHAQPLSRTRAQRPASRFPDPSPSRPFGPGPSLSLKGRGDGRPAGCRGAPPTRPGAATFGPVPSLPLSRSHARGRAAVAAAGESYSPDRNSLEQGEPWTVPS